MCALREAVANQRTRTSRPVPVGGYFIVEDTICHHGLDVGPKPGPYEAVDAFLAERAQFERDRWMRVVHRLVEPRRLPTSGQSLNSTDSAARCVSLTESLTSR
jgi:hypothetical protein